MFSTAFTSRPGPIRESLRSPEQLGQDLHDERVEGDALHLGPGSEPGVQRTGDAEAELTAEPRERKWVANAWRSVCGDNLPPMSAFFA
jgi:hypothetical protein